MFLQACYVKKVNEYLIDELEYLGYKLLTSNHHDTTSSVNELSYNLLDHPRAYMVTHIHTNNYTTVLNKKELPPVKLKTHIDCGNNDQLFLAIAAIRDDSNFMQWFTDGRGQWYLCDTEKLPTFYMINNYYKASIEEIINRFK